MTGTFLFTKILFSKLAKPKLNKLVISANLVLLSSAPIITPINLVFPRDALAEFVSGSEDVFVSKMNKLVQSLGLNDTNFVNATGLPAENHYSTAHDIAKIYRTICNNSIYRKFSKIWMEDFIHPSGRRTGLVNTNRLVKTFDGIEG